MMLILLLPIAATHHRIVRGGVGISPLWLQCWNIKNAVAGFLEMIVKCVVWMICHARARKRRDRTRRSLITFHELFEKSTPKIEQRHNIFCLTLACKKIDHRRKNFNFFIHTENYVGSLVFYKVLALFKENFLVRKWIFFLFFFHFRLCFLKAHLRRLLALLAFWSFLRLPRSMFGTEFPQKSPSFRHALVSIFPLFLSWD